MDELLSIGEFSEICQLSVKMLRHYHDLGLLTPARVDDSTGYRYYRFDQAGEAVLIARLRRLDVPLADIAEMVAGTEEDAEQILHRHRARLEEQRSHLTAVLRELDIYLSEERPMSYEISERALPAQRAAALRIEGPNTPMANMNSVMAGFTLLWSLTQSAGVTVDGLPTIVVLHGDEERFEQLVCLPIEEGSVGGAEIVELPAVTAAVARHAGSFNADPLAVMEWARKRGHIVGLPFWIVLVAVPPAFAAEDVAGTAEPVLDIVIPYGRAPIEPVAPAAT